MTAQDTARRTNRMSEWLRRVFLADSGRTNSVVPALRDYPVARPRR